MVENTQEKNLIEKKEGFFGKVKNFFKKLFKKKEKNTVEENVVNEVNKEKLNNDFKENIKIVENEETEEIKILELQKRYRRGEIAEKDLTDDQIDALSDLYDKQIEALRKIITEKEQQIAESKQQNIEKKSV